MIFIGIAALLLIAGIIVFCNFDNAVLFGIGVIAIIIFPFIGTAAISGYEEPIIQAEYELVPVYEPDTYIIEDSKGAVTCKHIIENEHPEAVKTEGLFTYKENAEIVVTEKGSKPIMKKYFTKAKKTIWTFALDCDKVEYVFYVPKENIEKWQNKHVY